MDCLLDGAGSAFSQEHVHALEALLITSVWGTSSVHG